MMLATLAIGLSLTALNGWLAIRLLEGRSVALFRGERLAYGTAFGITGSAFLAFLPHVLFGLPFTRGFFLALDLGMLLLLGGALALRRLAFMPPSPISSLPPEASWKRWQKIIVGLVGTWTAAKFLLSGIVFLGLTPTYLDDTLDNWNLRAKVFFVDQALTLVMPGEEAAASIQGISSYPPALPLSKTRLAALYASWSEPLANLPHLVWYACALAVVYYAVARMVGRRWGLLGVYLLGSMPLYLMHGTNPYADVFLSTHIAMAAVLLWRASREEDPTLQASFLRLGGAAAGLLIFTKNEALLLHLPVLLLLFFLWLAADVRRRRLTPRTALRHVFSFLLAPALIGLPWLLFKWRNGMTFGNAKSVGSLGIGWQEDVLAAVTINTLFEGNWLLLPVLLAGLLLWRVRTAAGPLRILAAYILIVYGGQLLLYLFTSLSVEARMQTGYARGLIQLLPVAVIVTTLLLHAARAPLERSLKALAMRNEMRRG